MKTDNKISVVKKFWGQKNFKECLDAFKAQSISSDLFILNSNRGADDGEWLKAYTNHRHIIKFVPEYDTLGYSMAASLAHTPYVYFDLTQNPSNPKLLERLVQQAECAEEFSILGNQGFILKDNKFEKKEQNIQIQGVDFVLGSFLAKRNAIPYIDFARTIFKFYNAVWNFPLFTSLACKTLSKRDVLLTCETLKEEEKFTDKVVDLKPYPIYISLIKAFKEKGLETIYA